MSRTSAHHGQINGVIVVSGYGLRIAVERGHLVVEDGVGARRHRDRFSRVDQHLKRIVIIGHSGSITLDAIDWLQGVGVPLIHLSHDGRLYFVSSSGARTVAQLRRAQALATETAPGLDVSRDLVCEKIAGQLRLLDQLPDGDHAHTFLEPLLDRARQANSHTILKDAEARAARAYWRAWRRVPLKWPRSEARSRPRHWRTFGSRISVLSDPSPRKAVNPANAVLNYLYAILEAEATIAALSARLDPAIGLLHADRTERASMACDLMEPVRPTVDAYALSLFRDRVFRRDDVFELRDGHCRLLPTLARELSATAPRWAERVRPIAQDVASILRTGKPLARKQGSGRRARGPTAVVRAFEEPGPAAADLQWTGMASFQRAIGANRRWDRENDPAGPDMYRAEIFPTLQNVPLKSIVAATGLAPSTCSLIRQGKRIPHPRHWEALGRIGS